MRAYFVALQFLTRLPSPLRGATTREQIGASLGWFPLVGASIGLLLVGVDRLASLWLARPVVDALLLVTLVAITGALHLDGLIDTVDGLLAGPDPGARLDAMRESAASNAGALAACGLLLAAFVALSSLSGATRSAALLLAPLCGRAAILLAYWRYPYARSEPTVSHALKAGATTRRALAGLASAILLGLAIAGPGALVLLGLTLLLIAAIARLAVGRLGGLTGDLYGAMAEVTQLVIWLLAPAGAAPVTSLLAALQFLTRAPLPVRFALGPADMGRSMRWFPFVGALIGSLVALIDAVLAPITTLEVRSVLAVLLLAAITGGLHLDGLMDSCDGLLAFTTPERRLKIMADSRVGSFAVVGLVTALLLKYAALLAPPAPLRAPGLVAIGALSRWTMVYATVRYPTARADGLGNTYKQGAGRRELVIASALVILLVLPLHMVGLAAVAIAWAVVVVLARYAIAKIGGLTGDVYGAISEATEIAVAVALPPLARALGG